MFSLCTKFHFLLQQAKNRGSSKQDFPHRRIPVMITNFLHGNAIEDFCHFGQFSPTENFSLFKNCPVGIPGQSLLREQMVQAMNRMHGFTRPIPRLPASIKKERDRKTNSSAVPFSLRITSIRFLSIRDAELLPSDWGPIPSGYSPSLYRNGGI